MATSVKNRCFVLRSFAPELQNVWDLAIRPAVEAAGLEAWDGREERLGSNIIHHDISSLIWHSRLIIAELSGRNPNVMYELGMAHAAKKPVIMLIEEGEDPPFDVKHIRYLEYNKYNLRGLYDDLVSRISTTFATPEEARPDLFPELRVLTDEVRKELAYLRQRSVVLDIDIFPTCADIFVNDKLIGSGPLRVNINSEIECNTVSASTVGFFEFHTELQPDDLARGELKIELERVHQPGTDVATRLSKRVPRWLRDRRRAPHNPVLMRAISSYLMAIGERADALDEIRELRTVAPAWFMSINQLGFYYGSVGELHMAVPYYQQVAALKPDHFIGHFNLACASSLLGELDDCLHHLRRILEDESALISARESLESLSHDPDFQNLVADHRRGREFREIELEIFPGAGDHDWTTPKDGGYQTF